MFRQHPASFRDPAGFVFYDRAGTLHRCVTNFGLPGYRMLMDSGLYAALRAQKLVVGHEEVHIPGERLPECAVTLRPEQLLLRSLPPEWTFGQLQAAAILTLRACRMALSHGMILKDAPASNVGFAGSTPVHIDTLSFEPYTEGKGWAGFGQFCRHFLYPLLVQTKVADWRPAGLMAYPDGLSAGFTASLLPRLSRWNMLNQLYLLLPARMEKRGQPKTGRQTTITRQNILRNIDALEGWIKRMKPAAAQSHWQAYYEETILSPAYLAHKEKLVKEWLLGAHPRTVIDLGANTGVFSLIAASIAGNVVAVDSDLASMNSLYAELQKRGTDNVSVIVADLTAPTPATGWMNAEQTALTDRIKGDTVLALALIHHLAISRNVTFSQIASLFAEVTGNNLLVEFIPKDDPRVQTLLAHREDVFPDYHEEAFAEALQAHFEIVARLPVDDSGRVLFAARKRGATAG